VRQLIVINDSGFAAGGATKLAIESALGAAARGWRVSFITQAGKLDPRFERAGVAVIPIEGARVSQGNPLSAMRTGLWNGDALKQVAHFIEKNDTSETIYHLHNWSHFFSPAIFKALKPIEDRLLLTTHDFFLSCGNGGQYDFKKNNVCLKVGNSPSCIVTNCDKQSAIHKVWRVGRHSLRSRVFPLQDYKGRVALIHENQRPFFERANMPADRIVTIRNPITALKSKRVAAEKNDSVLFIGRISVEKGADIAAKAAAAADMKIVFAGDGPLASQLKADYPNAEFAGFCDRETLSSLMQSARALIMPGRWAEPFGLVAGEALWSGVPVLIGNPAFLAEEIVSAGAGLSFDPLKLDDVVGALNQLNDNERVKQMSLAAFSNTRNIANSHEAWLDAYNSIYMSLLS